MPSRPLIFHSYAKKTRFPRKGFCSYPGFESLSFWDLEMPVLALALAISTLVQCNVILWVAFLFIYLFL